MSSRGKVSVVPVARSADATAALAQRTLDERKVAVQGSAERKLAEQIRQAIGRREVVLGGAVGGTLRQQLVLGMLSNIVHAGLVQLFDRSWAHELKSVTFHANDGGFVRATVDRVIGADARSASSRLAWHLEAVAPEHTESGTSDDRAIGEAMENLGWDRTRRGENYRQDLVGADELEAT